MKLTTLVPLLTILARAQDGEASPAFLAPIVEKAPFVLEAQAVALPEDDVPIAVPQDLQEPPPQALAVGNDHEIFVPEPAPLDGQAATEAPVEEGPADELPEAAPAEVESVGAVAEPPEAVVPTPHVILGDGPIIPADPTSPPTVRGPTREPIAPVFEQGPRLRRVTTDADVAKAAVSVRKLWLGIPLDKVVETVFEDDNSRLGPAERASLIASVISYSMTTRGLQPSVSLRTMKKVLRPGALGQVGTTQQLVAPNTFTLTRTTAPSIDLFNALARSATSATDAINSWSSNLPVVGQQSGILNPLIFGPVSDLAAPFMKASIPLVGSMATYWNRSPLRRLVEEPRSGLTPLEREKIFEWFVMEVEAAKEDVHRLSAVVTELFVDKLGYTDYFTVEEHEGGTRRKLSPAEKETIGAKIQRAATYLEGWLRDGGIEAVDPVWLEGARLYLGSFEPDAQTEVFDNLRKRGGVDSEGFAQWSADLAPELEVGGLLLGRMRSMLIYEQQNMRGDGLITRLIPKRG